MGKSFEEDQRAVEYILQNTGVLGFYSKDGRLLSVVYSLYERDYQAVVRDKALEKIFHLYLDAEAEELFGDNRYIFSATTHDLILGKCFIRVRTKHKRGAKEEIPATWDVLKRNFNYGKMFYL